MRFEHDVIISNQRVRIQQLEARLAASEAREATLRAVVKGAWRFWAAIAAGGAAPVEDRGYRIVRVRADKLAEFDALFSQGQMANILRGAVEMPSPSDPGEPRSGL